MIDDRGAGARLDTGRLQSTHVWRFAITGIPSRFGACVLSGRSVWQGLGAPLCGV